MVINLANTRKPNLKTSRELRLNTVWFIEISQGVGAGSLRSL